MSPFWTTRGSFRFYQNYESLDNFFRNQGIRCVVYLDDFLIVSDSYDECKKAVRFTCDFLEKIGFVIDKEKSKFSPSMLCKFSGFIFDLISMIMELPISGEENVTQYANKFLNTRECKIRVFAEFLGYLVSCCSAIKYSWDHMKVLERKKLLALKSNGDNYYIKMFLSRNPRRNLLWWLGNTSERTNSIHPVEYSLEIFSDASLIGWSIACNGVRSHSYWINEEWQLPINVLKLQAVFRF